MMLAIVRIRDGAITGWVVATNIADAVRQLRAAFLPKVADEVAKVTDAQVAEGNRIVLSDGVMLLPRSPGFHPL